MPSFRQRQQVATLRNSRGGRAERDCTPSSRASPRARRASRCIRAQTSGTSGRWTSATIAAQLAPHAARSVEFNIEGDPRPALIDLVLESAPDQCTLVPVRWARSRVRRAGRSDTPISCSADRAAAGRRAFGSACSSIRSTAAVRWAAVGRRSDRALHRAVCEGVRRWVSERAARASTATPTRRRSRTRSGLGSQRRPRPRSR